MMSLPVSLGLVGLGLGLLGSALLAVSLNQVIAALSMTADAHDVALDGLTDPRKPIIRFTGMDVHVENARRTAARRTALGLWALVFSFGLQAMSLVLAAT